MSYQGFLTDAAGLPVDQIKDMQFVLYDALTGGSVLFTDTRCQSGSPSGPGINVVRGRYEVEIGSETAGGVAPAVFTDRDAVWLEVRVDANDDCASFEALTPRIRLQAAAYAFKALQASSASVVHNDDFAYIRTGEGGVAGGLQVTSLGTPVLTIQSDGDVGIGTTNPQYQVESTGWIMGGCAKPGDAGDEMVAVGSWCVDKYEASVWSTNTGGTQYGSASDNYPCADTGQDCAVGAANAHYARSVSGVTPSRYITWFQANLACMNAGKELLPNDIWQAAAAGTVDPGSTGTAPNCNISQGLGGGPTTTGAGTSCVSTWGAQDMIGSLWEWVGDWLATGTNYTNSGADGTQYNTWPAAYNGDATYNMGTRAFDGAAWQNGSPSAVRRGGNWDDGADAGVFALSAGDAPSRSSDVVGFRCGRRR